MAQIIQFQPKVSNAYSNLSRFINESESTDVVEFYAGTIAVCHEEGIFLPGEVERITEQTRSKRLDLAKPEQIAAQDATKPGTYYYTPEMDQKKPQCQIEAHRSYYGKHYYIDTPLDLKGRGIRHIKKYEAGDLSASGSHKSGWNEYEVTERAFNLLAEKYSISQEVLLD